MSILWKILTRKKVLDADATQETPLARVLNTFDLTALGVGSTLGVGVYVLAGQVSKSTAGPAVIISFLIAAIASVFAGLCYAEFGARTPRAGSAYIYSYLCVGEFIAFVIGWNLILEYIIGSASVAKGLSSYIDDLLNGTLSKTFERVAPMDIPYFSPYFDFFAFTISVLLAIALAFGMKESSLVNNIFTSINIGVVLFVIIGGAFNANIDNWFINPADVKNETIHTKLGEGGFFPFGIEGVIKGAATCFYGFVGFDCIATTGEEVKNPRKAIPIAIICSLFIIFLAYFGTSTVITLMVPYYEQDGTAPIPFAFKSVHWYTAALIVTIGALFGLYASLFGAMFPLPRILYAMASDGLIFKCLGKVNERFKTPVIGTLVAGLFTGVMSAMFELDSLVNMMSIGTLLAYTIVAACVLLLRYSVDEKGSYAPISGSSDSEEVGGYMDTPENTSPINDSEDTVLTSVDEETSFLKQIFNFGGTKFPTNLTQTIVSVDICVYCVLCCLLGLCALHLKHNIIRGEIFAIVVVSVILVLMALTILSIVSQPISRKVLSFQVPWVPLIPALSILFNIYLMIMLDNLTWIRFVVWMIVGMPCFYCTRKNVEKKQKIGKQTSQGRVNNGFYDDNLLYSKSENSFSNEETRVIVHQEKKPCSINLFESQVDDSIILTPSPSRAIESLDLVIDSFFEGRNSPVSLDRVSSAYNASLGHISNSKECSDDLIIEQNSSYAIESTYSVDGREKPFKDGETGATNDIDVCCDVDLENTEAIKSSKDSVIERDGTNIIDSKRTSISDSENSFVSAMSDTNECQNVSDIKTFEENIIPPPPPSMENFVKFTKSIKVNSDSDMKLKNGEKIPKKTKDSPMIINESTLSSVKLRHVERPSLERNHLFSNTLKPNSTPRTSSSYLRSKSVNSVQDAAKGAEGDTRPKMTVISKAAIDSVKLKPVRRPSLSSFEKKDIDRPDSLMFGSMEFNEFKRELNDKLSNPVKIPRAPSYIDPNKVSNKKIVIDRENVLEDRIDVEKARATITAEINAKLNFVKRLENKKLLNKSDDNVNVKSEVDIPR